jgi:flagellar hook-length control protein FliK
MSLLVSPNNPAAQASSSASTGNASQQQADAGDFGQLLNRSLNQQDKTADKPSDSASSIVKPAAPGTARRPADADKDGERQDDTGLQALAFMPQQSATVNPLTAKTGFGGDNQTPSAAEKQLNAAIAAAGGKPGMQTAPEQPVMEPSAPQPLFATAAVATMAALAPANADTSAPAASASKETIANTATAIAHGAELPLRQAAVGDRDGQQASSENDHADRQEKIEKQEKQDGRSNNQFAVRHADGATATGAAAIQSAAAKPSAVDTSPLRLDMPGQPNPTLANSQVAANPGINSTTLPEPPKLMLAPAVGSDGWAPALGKQMVWLGKNGSQTAELHLNPPDLGPLKVTLTLNDSQAQAMFVSAHQSVRSALEAALPQLRNSLAESGISLGHTSVSADTQQQQQQSAFAQHQSSQQGASGHFQRNIGAADRNPLTERSPVAATVGKNGNGKVDIFA